MPGVAISGYMVSYILKDGKEEKYGVVDLLQFGAKNQRSELVPLLVYDPEIRDWLFKCYEYGKIFPCSFICSVISIPKTKDTMWVVERVIDYRKKDIRDYDGVGSPTADTGSS